MPPIKCFMLEPTDREERALRRYTYSNDEACPAHNEDWGHDVQVAIEPGPAEGEGSASGDLWPHDDSRWPKHCDCGYEFKETDEWQLSCSRLYRRIDTGEELALDYRTLPAGAMFWATWFSGDNFAASVFWKGRGAGSHLMVNTPGGIWDVDSIASNGPGWQWSGTPPNVTASASILIQNTNGSERYHGWLRNGELIDA